MHCDGPPWLDTERRRRIDQHAILLPNGSGFRMVGSTLPNAMTWKPRTRSGMTTSPWDSTAISFLNCGLSTVALLIFSRKIFSHPAALSWASWLVRSWVSVVSRA